MIIQIPIKKNYKSEKEYQQALQEMNNALKIWDKLYNHSNIKL